ncbi:amino acid adenylation domain-containing protein [Methylocella sp.]|uniref:amino acid adenylation domain-containing protein n=1 Tax=Methylocella sp. TaxID=1978226 RepID=UPI0037845C10
MPDSACASEIGFGRYARGRSVGACFRAAAQAFADRPAVLSDARGPMSFAELDRRSDACARALAAAGVRPGDVVALFMPRSPEAIVAMLGALKAGAAFAPLDPAYPAEHLAFIAADAAPAAVLVRPQDAGPDFAAPRLAVDAAAPFEDGPAPEPRPQGEDPCYVMYTSGTTGRPKGVVVPHRGVTRLAFNSFADLGPGDVVMQFAPLAFDASTFEIWCALLNGAAVAIVAEEHPGFSELGAAIARHGVTVAWLTASLFHAVVDRQVEILKPLRLLLAGGDVLSPRHLRRAFDALPSCRIVNGYGPTENTTFTCCHEIARDLDPNAPVPIGRAIDHSLVYVLDPALKPVPDGETGELFAGGEGVALRYLNRPELTAEKFLADPFCGEDGRLMYRTGDLVRRRPDGVVEFLGRVDRQVKIRGKRVEVDEVEALLRRLPGVADACAVVRERTDGERQIVGYVTGRDGAALDAPALRRTMLEISPDFLVPAILMALPELPRTPNGKVDRAALPQAAAPEPPGQGAAPPAQGSGDSFERRVADVWARVLRAPPSSLDANFFDLGGASLDVMAMQEEIRKAFAIDAPMTDLFQHTTVRSLAAHLRRLATPDEPSGSDQTALDDLSVRKARQAEALKRAARRRAAPA